jgi:hypothetical protein
MARFKQAARELGCDESEERFVETVRKIRKGSAAAQGCKAGAKQI